MTTHLKAQPKPRGKYAKYRDKQITLYMEPELQAAAKAFLATKQVRTISAWATKELCKLLRRELTALRKAGIKPPQIIFPD